MRNRSPLVPRVYSSDEEDQRYRHEDLSEKPTPELWAEATLVGNELASQIHNRIDRPYGCLHQDDHVHTERDWLGERHRRIATELRRRRQR